tara:strand:+ start:4576 stop:5277 length:702 start_codon:yes stop_codon:yes gene_type:complete
MSSEYKRIQNTYYFNLTSAPIAAGGLTQEINFQIPSLPSFPNGESKTGIFRLLSATVGNQHPLNNIANNSGFYLDFSGLSLRPQCFGGDQGISFQAVNRFWIPNKFTDTVTTHGARTITSDAYQIPAVITDDGGGAGVNSTQRAYNVPAVVSTFTAETVANGFAGLEFNTQTGCELSNPYEVICGNPSGNTGGIRLFDEHGAVLAATVGNINQLIMNTTFSIELIDPDDDQNF